MNPRPKTWVRQEMILFWKWKKADAEEAGS
jgi:hypothetical protein